MASYVTKEGLEKMKAELEQLETVERPKLLSRSQKLETREICLKMQNMMRLKRLRECLK